MKTGFVTDDGRFLQTSQRQFGARGVYLSFSWSFGQQPRGERLRASEDSQPGPEGAAPR